VNEDDENGDSSYEDVAQANIRRNRLARAVHNLITRDSKTIDLADVGRVLALIESTR
jgi:hypothetical protein